VSLTTIPLERFESGVPPLVLEHENSARIVARATDTHASGTATLRAAVHQALRPQFTVLHDVRAHLATLERELHDAELAAHDGVLDDKMRYMHTRIAAAQQYADATVASLRALAQVLVEVEKGLAQDALEIAALLSTRTGRPGAR
jgi:hypothetical protein